jgi:hypothetical protein
MTPSLAIRQYFNSKEFSTGSIQCGKKNLLHCSPLLSFNTYTAREKLMYIKNLHHTEYRVQNTEYGIQNTEYR